MKYVTNNDKLIYYVIKASQKIFKEREQKYIGPYRLNKLTILVSKELEENNIHTEGLVWGYYRHGFFSRTVQNSLKINFGKKFNISQLDMNKVNIPNKLAPAIYESISKLRKNFVRDRKNFVKWVYKDITPTEYRNFYLTHKELEKWFKKMENDLTNENLQLTLFGKKDSNVSYLISKYYFSLDHVKDPEILEIFRKFTDIIEFISLKWNNGANSSKILVQLNRLSNLYEDKLFAILTPYLETLKGDEEVIETEKTNHINMIQEFKIELNTNLDEIYDQLDEENLIPTFEELHNEIETLSQSLPEDSKSLRELYDELSK